MYNLLYKYRIPLLSYPVYTQLAGTQQQNINEKLNTSIGLIYGVSIDTDGVDPTNRALITFANAADLYLTLVQGSSNFLFQVRLSNFNFMNDLPAASGQLTNPYRFLPVNVPGIGTGQEISLDQSYYNNPTLINGAFIKLNFWYLTPNNVRYLQSKGAILPIGM